MKKTPKRAKPLDMERAVAKVEFEKLWESKLAPLTVQMIWKGVPPHELCKCMAWEVFNLMRKQKGNGCTQFCFTPCSSGVLPDG